MNAGRTDKEFDDLLRKRYEDHTIEPEESLWEGINMRLYQKKIDRNIHKIRQLKIAISAVAAILTGVIVYSLIGSKENRHEIQMISELPVKQATAEKAEGDLLKLNDNNKLNVELSADLNKTANDNLNPVSNQKITEAINETSASFTQFINPVPDSSYSRVFSLTTSEFHDTSLIKSNDIKLVTDINNSTENKSTVLKIIRKVPEKSNQAELILPETDRGVDKSEQSATSGNGKKQTRLFIEGSVSPEISYRVLLANTRYSIPDYGKTYFNKTENPDLTFSTGVSGGIRITDKLILKAGAYYSRYSYKLKTEAFNLIYTGSDGYLAYTSSGPVNITLISSDSISKESFIKSSISFSFVNIPVMAELHLGNNYFLNLGLNLNMLSGQNMNWKSEDYDGNFSETAADPIDGLEFGSLSMNAGIGKEKYITRQLSILVNPSVRINLTALNTTAPVKSYPYSWGLNAGLRYYFD